MMTSTKVDHGNKMLLAKLVDFFGMFGSSDFFFIDCIINIGGYEKDCHFLFVDCIIDIGGYEKDWHFLFVKCIIDIGGYEKDWHFPFVKCIIDLGGYEKVMRFVLSLIPYCVLTTLFEAIVKELRRRILRRQPPCICNE